MTENKFRDMNAMINNIRETIKKEVTDYVRANFNRTPATPVAEAEPEARIDEERLYYILDHDDEELDILAADSYEDAVEKARARGYDTSLEHVFKLTDKAPVAEGTTASTKPEVIIDEDKYLDAKLHLASVYGKTVR